MEHKKMEAANNRRAATTRTGEVRHDISTFFFRLVGVGRGLFVLVDGWFRVSDGGDGFLVLLVVVG